MCCSANHDVLVSSGLDAFLSGTFHVGVKMVPGEPPELVGSCPTCAEQLSIHICECRGIVVSGEIGR
jgi:hypothetical protein